MNAGKEIAVIDGLLVVYDTIGKYCANRSFPNDIFTILVESYMTVIDNQGTRDFLGQRQGHVTGDLIIVPASPDSPAAGMFIL